MITSQLLIGFVAGIAAMVFARPAIGKATMWTLGATKRTRKAVKGAYNWIAAIAFIALMFIIVKQGGF
jgi:TRAP-type C4-dicarboxylate transport system permease small subunit